MQKVNQDITIEEKGRFSGKKKWLPLILILLPVLMLAGGYLGIACYYQTRFFKNTYINDIACGNLEATAAAAFMDQKADEYSLEVYGRNPRSPEENILLGTIRAQDIAYSHVNNRKAAQELLEKQNAFLWIGMLADKQYVYQVDRGVSFDKEMLNVLLQDWDAFRKENMIKPKDAYISDYQEKENAYTVVPDSPGSQIDTKAAAKIIEEAILQQESTVNLEESGCYTTAQITAQNKILCETVDNINKWLDTVITYDWNGTEVILEKEQIRDWVSVEDDKPVLDEEAVLEFVKEQARKNDTFGRNRRFTTTLGVELTLPSAYGWLVNRQAEAEALKELIYQGAVAEREPIYSIEAFQKGSDDIGSSYVEIDLSNQHLYLYYEGELILETDFVSGNMSNGNYTPPGIYGLTYKTKDAVLRGATYETPVKYWMPFNGNVGMHDATWRRSFGGNIFMTSGSHGCVNLPLNQAEVIYEYVSDGFPIICYYYQPVEEIVAQLQGQPADIPPETPEGGTPENPEGGTPENPEGGTPENPEGGTPENPEGGTPENPEGGTPENPEGGTPENPEGGTPETPEGGTPQPPEEGTPEAP